MLVPWTKKLRLWQDQALQTYTKANKQDFLLVATPGAGKTVAAARIAHDLLQSGRVALVVVLCPTTPLKTQWAKALTPFGIHLDPNWENAAREVGDDYLGIIATYQQIVHSPDLHRHHCRVPTLLIADEIHHAGDDSSWGKKLRHAFDPAVRRLLLSGTPFRSNGEAIPYVRYDMDIKSGKIFSKADFTYGYGEALRDQVCRPILFPSYEGKMRWQYGFETRQAAFHDELSEADARQRLRTALDPDGGWIKHVLGEANQRLKEISANGDPRAGGLILCSDQEHARRIKRTLEHITGEVADLVVSEEDGAAQRILTYAEGHTRWLIAVRMVSEGVDIPRLRVGVYATHWIAERFFRQAVGRFVRMIRDANDRPMPEEQSAYLFIPKEETLIAYVEHIKEERDHELAQEIERLQRGEQLTPDTPQPLLYTPLASEAHKDNVYFNGTALDQGEIAAARELIVACGVSMSAENAALLLRHYRGTVQPGPVATSVATIAPAPVTADPLYMRKNDLRKTVTRLVSQVVQASNGAHDHAAVYTALMNYDGVSQKLATLEQLEARMTQLYKWLEEWRRG